MTFDKTQSINDSDKNSSINAIKVQVAIIKENSTSAKSNNQRSKKSKNQISKAMHEKASHTEMVRDSMFHERGVNKNENIKVRIR